MGVKPSTTICAKVDSLPILGMMVIPPLLTGNPYNPYYWVDGHPLLHGKSQVVSRISEPSTVRPTTSFIFLPSDLLLRCPYGPSVEVVVMQSHGMCPQIEGTKWAATFWGSFQWMVQWLGSSRQIYKPFGWFGRGPTTLGDNNDHHGYQPLIYKSWEPILQGLATNGVMGPI